MSSMDRKALLALLTSVGLMASSGPLQAGQFDQASAARVQLVASQPRGGFQTVERWRTLRGSDMLDFASYAGFLLAYPGFPQEDALRRQAEDSLERGSPPTAQLLAFFDRYPPLTNAGVARYALALSTMGSPQATEWAVKAWRGGRMSGPSEAYLVGLFGSRFTPADQDARMDALLWQGDGEAAARQINLVSPTFRPLAEARLALLRGNEPTAKGIAAPASAMADAGFVYNLARYYRKTQQGYRAVELFANRPAFVTPAHDAGGFISEALTAAKGAGARQAQQIAAKVDDLFAPATTTGSTAPPMPPTA